MARKKGKPALEDGELAVRINISLPLSLAQRFRQAVPEKTRSELVARLLRAYLDEQQGQEANSMA